MWKLESVIQPEEEYMTAILRTLIASVHRGWESTFGEIKAVIISAMVVVSSHPKSYQSHGVSSERDER